MRKLRKGVGSRRGQRGLSGMVQLRISIMVAVAVVQGGMALEVRFAIGGGNIGLMRNGCIWGLRRCVGLWVVLILV